MMRAVCNRLKYMLTRSPKEWGAVRYYPGVEDEIEAGLKAAGFSVEPLTVDPAEFREYVSRAGYDRFAYYYEGGRGFNFHEKALEHFVALELLGLKGGDVYIDIANDGSPVPEIYTDLTGAEAWRQDLKFEPGVHDRKVGGDASSLPLPDGFASAMAMHCSFEHFEGESDSRFIAEAGRLLRSGGKLVILPLYLFPHYAIQTDPMTWEGWSAPFEADGATIHFAIGHGNRHGRFYSPEQLALRVGKHLGPLRMSIRRVTNAGEIDPGCYLRFIAVFEK